MKNKIGVYILWQGNKLIYIGKSINLGRRIFNSIKEKRSLGYSIDSYSIIVLKSECDALEMEKELIFKYDPECNLKHNDHFPLHRECLLKRNPPKCDIDIYELDRVMLASVTPKEACATNVTLSIDLLTSDVWFNLSPKQQQLYIYCVAEKTLQNNSNNTFNFNKGLWHDVYKLYPKTADGRFHKDMKQIIKSGLVLLVSSGKDTRQKNVYKIENI